MVWRSVSRAFTKEDAQHEGVMVLARAPLPDGVENLVTPRGLALLHEEEADMLAELGLLRASGDDQRKVAELETALDELLHRIATAIVVDPAANDKSAVRFGDTVTVEPLAGGARFEVTIVGVDEADPEDGRVSFLAPIAERLLGCRVGQVAEGAGRGVRVVAIG